ncbi:MAG: hypothetical protein EXQ94_07110 [Alphaproteobacteria bacterium]|nr:hypothetical protein [Alphaproteobacteria bacterium]
MSQARTTLLREALSDSAIGYARDEHEHPTDQRLSRWSAMIVWLLGCGALWGLIALFVSSG